MRYLKCCQSEGRRFKVASYLVEPQSDCSPKHTTLPILHELDTWNALFEDRG